MSAQALQTEVLAPPIMRVEGLSMYFPVGGGIGPFGVRQQLHAVDEVSFSLRPGRVTALVGESGSGKSTVARCLARLYTPTAGSIYFHDADVTNLKSRNGLRRYRSQVQMIYQDPFGSLNPVKLVEHHIARPLIIHNIVPRGQIRQRVYELLTTVGLSPAEEFARKYPHQLSGGQQQRLLIARALLLDVRLLVADEIISMLDASTRIDILNLLISLKRSGLAILFITHDLSLGNYVSDRTVILRHGAIVEMGDTVKVFGNPRHPYTRNLLTAVPELHKKWQPPAIGNGTRPAAAPGPEVPSATAFDPPPLTECEENHLVAEDRA
jgi:peptide/nickel transport system ATP-binding protein